MGHQPAPLNVGVPPFAVALVALARQGRLVIYAGAGISRAEPAGLPAGAAVAARVFDRLVGAFPQIQGCDPEDLVAVADAVAALPNGEDALRRTAVQVAEFTTAVPNYGHRVLALMLLEGLLDVLTTNWDDCIERGGGREHVYAVVTEHDLASIAPRSVLKVHGCATRPSSLLVSSAHLDHPPPWVVEQTHARLGTSVVAFVGIGDIAGYVRTRVMQAVSEVGNVANIRVASLGISENWSDSQWAEVVPNLDSDHRFDESADAFLEKLGAAYVLAVFAEVWERLQAEPGVAEPLAAALTALKNHDASTVLAWARGSGVVPAAGSPVLSSAAMATALVALGRLAGNDFKITRDGTIASAAVHLEVLVAVGTQPASRLRREAEIRREVHVGNGIPEPKFLVSGGVGWPGPGQHPMDDILGYGGATDVLDGPLAGTPTIILADQLLTG